MPLPQGLSKTELQRPRGKDQLRKHYKQHTKGLRKTKFNLHHTNPSSRGGETNEFNLFPYKIIRHNSWHTLFLNMTIWEVWEALDDIYEAIFNSDEQYINRHWLSVCKLPSENDLKNQIEKEYLVEYLKDRWGCAFGGRKLAKARKFLRYMMLFVIFGSDMACPKKIFRNEKVVEFFDKFPITNERQWAFEVCFGTDTANTDWNVIRPKIL